ncbi:MAG TPA: glycosyltransferase [Erysipelotrichaceae bacterium]|nr:glycosyltransferase [Erysipelotrichaceae bacterium]
MKKVSILVPIYNVQDYLSRCLNSLLDQTYKNIEIICINDGSTDQSGLLAKRFAQDNEHVFYYEYENSGISKTRNRALQLASGDYLMFVDSDDYIDSQMVEKMVYAMESQRCDMVTCSYIIHYPSFILGRKNCAKGIMTPVQALTSLAEGTGIDNYPWAKLFKKELFNNISFPESKNSFEDAYTIFKTIQKSERIATLPNRYYHYVQRLGSLTSKMDLEKVYAMRKSVDYQANYIARHFPESNIHFDTQYFNADVMIMYTLLRYYNKNDHVRFEPADIHWQHLSPIKYIGYRLAQMLVHVKLGQKPETVKDWEH